jgi:hypothetical protein
MRSNQGYSKYNTYKDRDEFSRSFLRRMDRLNEMDIEGDSDFMNDYMDYSEWCSDNYRY